MPPVDSGPPVVSAGIVVLEPPPIGETMETSEMVVAPPVSAGLEARLAVLSPDGTVERVDGFAGITVVSVVVAGIEAAVVSVVGIGTTIAVEVVATMLEVTSGAVVA